MSYLHVDILQRSVSHSWSQMRTQMTPDSRMDRCHRSSGRPVMPGRAAILSRRGDGGSRCLQWRLFTKEQKLINCVIFTPCWSLILEHSLMISSNAALSADCFICKMWIFSENFLGLEPPTPPPPLEDPDMVFWITSWSSVFQTWADCIYARWYAI